MNNNAFKDLVRSYGGSSSGNSSKEIARKAVEEEFRKKKKRKHSGDVDSSDDDEDDRRSFHKKAGKRQQKEEGNESDNNAEAIQKDLASRYRDRAKERREGKVGKDSDTKTDEGASNNFLIVPHNKKGLDLTLIRKERVALQSKSGGGNRQLATVGNAGDRDKSKVRAKLPTIDEAYEILQAFLSRNEKKNFMDDDYDDYGSLISISNGVSEYLGEIINWKTLDVSTFEGESSSGASARNSLHYTKFSLAIDGHPSDWIRAWENPRQYTTSRGNATGGSLSSPPLVSADLVNKIDRVFRNKNIIREEMMKRKSLNPNQSENAVKESKVRQTVEDESKGVSVDDEESDEDMFGGLDD